MAEMERLKADEKAFTVFEALHSTTKKTLEKAFNLVTAVQNTGSDEIDTT
jgi:hypothetical protein